MSSPKHKIAKCYQVNLKHAVDQTFPETLKKGVLLNDDDEIAAAAEAELTDEHTLLMTITEGKYHQVKRMIAAAGNRVESLHRLSFDTWNTEELTAGQWKFIHP